MINLQFTLADGSTVMVYDVHPRSQEQAIPLPEGAVAVAIWMGTS